MAKLRSTLQLRRCLQITTTILLPFDCNSTALQTFDDLRYDPRPTLWIAALRPKYYNFPAVAYICRKIWGSGLVRSSHQTVSDYTLRQWFSNTETVMGKIYGSVIFFSQQSQFLTACRRLEKSVLPFIFDIILSSLMIWNFQRPVTRVLIEQMWHF